MNGLLTGIMTKLSGSSLATAIGSRLYADEAPQNTTFPYVVFFIVSANQQDTFSYKVDDVLIQFSIFSNSPGLTEITGIYNNLIALFDDAALTISGKTQIWMIRQNLTTMVDEIPTSDSNNIVRHWAVDYSVMVQG